MKPDKGIMQARIDEVQRRIARAASGCGRDPEAVRLVAVSKTVPPERVKTAAEAGLRVFGENYIQEAREKFDALAAYPVHWHFIGHLQSNKAKYAVRLFELIHSVDSEKLARELDKQAAKAGKVQDVLVQVNISREASKSGVDAQAARALLAAIGTMEHLRVKGLMTMPPFFDAPEKARPYFRALRELRERLRTGFSPDLALDELSMGMTGDFEVAIEEGATLVRIGTAIFGERA